MNLTDELERLSKLLGSGALSNEEFKQAKSRLLSGSAPTSTATKIEVSALTPATNHVRRFPAFLIDVAAIWIVLWSLSFVLPNRLTKSETALNTTIIIYALFRDAILPGGSLGKRMSGLALLDVRTGRSLSRGATILRQFCCYFGMFIGGLTSWLIGVWIWDTPNDPIQYIVWGFIIFCILVMRRGRTFCDRTSNAVLVLSSDYERLSSNRTNASQIT